MIKLGITGMSEGNGHPYSWAAIINGYDTEAMKSCPFPVIPEYLGRQSYPDDFISGAKVTHIWTQTPETSKDIAAASKIDKIVDTPEQMLGKIDALLHARDDYENHEQFVAPFLRAGQPVYIDKPLANTQSKARALLAMCKNDTQMFTCSALRYAKELEHVRARKDEITVIDAHTPKSWSLYSIHIIEPIISILGTSTPELIKHEGTGEGVELSLKYGKTNLNLKSAGIAQGSITFTISYRDGSSEHIVIKDMFYAFRSALEAFLNQINTQKLSIPRDETMACISIIEMGKIE